MRRLASISKRANEISAEEYAEFVKASKDPDQLAKIRRNVERKFQVPWQQGQKYSGIQWASIWDWLVSHWPEILKFILSILPLLMLETPNEVE